MTNGKTRIPPNDKDAEMALIGIMLKDERAVSDVLVVSKAQEFHTKANQFIFGAIAGLANDGKKADLVTVAEYLISKGQMDDVTAGYLAKLYEEAPSVSTNYRQYADIIRNHWMRRTAINVSYETIEKAHDLMTPAIEVVERAEKDILSIADATVSGSNCTLEEALAESYERLDNRVQRFARNERIGVPTGLIDVDTLIAGFQPNEMIIIAARPSVGKSSFGLQCAAFAAVEERIPAFFISLEQGRTELSERLLCAYAQIDSYRMRRGYLNADEIARIMDAGAMLAKAPLFFDDAPAQSMMRISANCRRMVERNNVQIVFIDYLQLIDSDNPRASRQEQVSGISRRIKALARELKIPVVAMAQLNRQADDGKNTRPKMSHLKESGAIEQDADTVMMLHRDRPEDPQSEFDLIVAKQRNGPTGDCKLAFQKPFMRFTNFEVQTTMMPTPREYQEQQRAP